MRSTRVAEWILAQVTSRERAEAVIGDLLESVPARGQLWFWWSVVTTAFALVWRDVAANPIRMLGLGFGAFLLQIVLIFLLVFVAAAVFGIIAVLGNGIQTLDPQHLATWLPGSSISSTVVTWCLAALIQFQIGRWLARRSPDHELAPCVAYSIVGLTFSLGLSLSFAQPGTLQAIRAAVSAALFVVFDLPLYAGAVSVRRKGTSA